MRSNEERVNNIYNKVIKYNIKRKKNIKKMYILTGIIASLLLILAYINDSYNNWGISIEDSNSKIVYSSNSLHGLSNKFTINSDSIPLIIYAGNTYTFDGFTSCDETKKRLLLGEYLGYASGSLSTKNEPKSIFASLIATGEVYSVNGYDKNFRISIFDEESSKLIFYDNLNDPTLKLGYDLFNKLNLQDNYKEIVYQIHDDYMNTSNNYRACKDLNKKDIDNFIKALYKSSFVKMTFDEQMVRIPDYDTEGEDIGHLYFNMNDGTIIDITLFKNGYIHYRDMGGVYIYMQDKIFSKVFQAITQNENN